MAQIQSCLEAINSLEAKEADLRGLEQEMRQTEAIAKRYNELKQRVCEMFLSVSNAFGRLFEAESQIIKSFLVWYKTKNIFLNLKFMARLSV